MARRTYSQTDSKKSIPQNMLLQDFPWDLAQSGVSVEEMLQIWHDALQNDFSLFDDIHPVTQYNDEPKMNIFHASVNIPGKEKYFGLDGEGFSFSSSNLAMVKCLGEAAERISNFFCHQKTVSLSLTDIHQHKIAHLDPRSVTGVYEKNWPLDKKIVWTVGWDLFTKNALLIPAQMVWLSGNVAPNEPVIWPRISTGAAAHSSAAAAITSGILECLERDAFMINYLAKLPRARIDLTSDPELAALNQRARRYNLEVAVLEMTTDIPVPSFVALVLDHSAIGPAVTIGLNTHPDAKTAIIGAIEEAFHPRSWLRSKFHEREQGSSAKPTSIEQRGLDWSDQRMIKHVDFWIKTSIPQKKLSEFPTLSTTEQKPSKQFLQLKKHLRAKKQRAFVVNIAHPELKAVNLHVVKIIMPDLHPLQLEEKFLCTESTRLHNVPEWLGFPNSSQKDRKYNTIPHPFL